MQVFSQQRAGTTVLTIQGRLDVQTSEQLKVYWTQDEAKRYFIVDLSETEFIDSVGLAALVTGLKIARASEGDLLLVNPNNAVRIILDLTAMIRVFLVFTSVEEALAAVSAS